MIRSSREWTRFCSPLSPGRIQPSFARMTAAESALSIRRNPSIGICKNRSDAVNCERVKVEFAFPLEIGNSDIFSADYVVNHPGKLKGIRSSGRRGPSPQC